MATATGVVKKIKGSIAEIVIERETMCGDSCSNCGLCSDNKTVIKAVNTAGAEVGDAVEVSVVTGFSIAAAALVYAVPLVLLFAGLIIMIAFSLPELTALLCVAAAIVIWFVIMSELDKKGKFKKYSATVTRRIL